jgi:hypothetical protein
MRSGSPRSIVIINMEYSRFMEGRDEREGRFGLFTKSFEV